MADDTASRNDLCPCGSGRKFKRCHGRPIRYPLINPFLFIAGVLLVFALVFVIGLNYRGSGKTSKDPAPASSQRVTRYDSIPGLALQSLSSAEQTQLVNHLNHTPCTCDCNMTVAECRHLDPACKHSKEIAESNLAQLVGAASPLLGTTTQSAH